MITYIELTKYGSDYYTISYIEGQDVIFTWSMNSTPNHKGIMWKLVGPNKTLRHKEALLHRYDQSHFVKQLSNLILKGNDIKYTDYSDET